MTTDEATGDDVFGSAAPGPGTWKGGLGLERRYRRLLLAYPRSYRRAHGPEFITTLMDAAAPGRDRPTRREVRDLLLGGLRQRFRLPVGRVMVLVAIGSAIALGAFGSAAGSALGWATGPATPDDAEVGAIAGLVTGEPTRWTVARDTQVFGLQPRAIVAMAAPDGLTGDTARSRMAAEGWRVGPMETRGGAAMKEDGTTVPITSHVFVAERGGVELLVSVDRTDGYAPHAFVVAQGAEPAVVLPLMLAGLVVGLVGGWLLAARVGYRVRRLSPVRRLPHLVAALVAAGALGISVPAALSAVAGSVVTAVGADRMDPDRFGGVPVFAAYHIDSPWDPVTLTGLGALALLLVFVHAIAPLRSATRSQALS